jgi:hypothetical protein
MRVLVIDNQHQVLTEFDGDGVVYTGSSKALPDVFKAIRAGRGAPAWEELNDRDAFHKFAQSKNLKALGSHPTDPRQGFLFAAYPDPRVKQTQQSAAATH